MSLDVLVGSIKSSLPSHALVKVRRSHFFVDIRKHLKTAVLWMGLSLTLIQPKFVCPLSCHNSNVKWYMNMMRKPPGLCCWSAPPGVPPPPPATPSPPRNRAQDCWLCHCHQAYNPTVTKFITVERPFLHDSRAATEQEWVGQSYLVSSRRGEGGGLIGLLTLFTFEQMHPRANNCKQQWLNNVHSISAKEAGTS